MHIKPKDTQELFWDMKLDCIPAEDDLYVGKGATYSPYQSYFPYTVVEITGELGNRIAKLRDCNYDGNDFYDLPDPQPQEWDRNDGFLYIKEKDISFKRLSGITYDNTYVKNRKTNRLRKNGGYVKVGYRCRHTPLEL